MSRSPRDPGRRERAEKPAEGLDQTPRSADGAPSRRLSQKGGPSPSPNPSGPQRPSADNSVVARRPDSEPKSQETPSVYVPSGRVRQERRPRWPYVAAAVLAVGAIVAVGIMVSWPRLNPRRLDPVERVAEDYLKALSTDDSPAIKRLGTVEEPPAIRSVRSVIRDPAGQLLKGSFAPLGQLHARIDAEYIYDSSAGRFTPKNAMGAAADTLDKLHAAKEDAEKSGLYKKMQSGDPEELFDAAEQFGKVFTQLADGALAPKKILPTYKMLVDDSKPPLPEDAKALALEFAAAAKDWDALLKRSFHTLKADGPFIYERALVNATAMDRLASSGDPPSRLRLTLVRFRLEGIDSGWKVISVRRILPGDEAKKAESAPSSASQAPPRSPGEPRSLNDAPAQQ
jgi:hypothetical protein